MGMDWVRALDIYVIELALASIVGRLFRIWLAGLRGCDYTGTVVGRAVLGVVFVFLNFRRLLPGGVGLALYFVAAVSFIPPIYLRYIER